MYNDLLFDLRYAELKKKHPQVPMYALCGRAADAIESLDKEAQQQREHIKMLHDALTNVLETNKWISVEEALPEVGDVVLAMGKRHATTGQFQGIGSKPCYWLWKGKTIKTVTLWRPLPPPPIEGSADDV